MHPLTTPKSFPLFALIWISALFAGQNLQAQNPVSYQVSLKNAVHHEAQIEVIFDNIGSDVLQLRMSRSSPGRYALHEFAKNIYRVTAEDQQGNALSIDRPSPYQWNINNHRGYVKVSYTLFANRADGTYSQIDSTHAHLNIPATFLWARGFDHRSVEIEFSDFDPQWKIATQLVPAHTNNRFTAPDLQYFMDSPIEISDFSYREFEVASNDKIYTIKLAIHHDAEESEVDEFTESAEAVVREHMAVYGELPDFDYGSYLFIADYLPHVNSDGMEHRNSTVLTNSRGLAGNVNRLQGTLSHEFFHSWNVERLRPQSLQPFNFEKANMSRELWFAEGFTSYYGNLLLRRSGLRTEQQYLGTLENLVNSITGSTGRSFFSPVEMSMQAPFVDAAAALDPTSFRNTFFSYYTYGAALALALDLTLRSEHQTSLDDYMKSLWHAYGKNEAPYEIQHLIDTLATLTSDRTFAEGFFNRYIFSSELPDYKKLLANAGLLLQEKNAEQANLGSISLRFENKKAIIEDMTQIDSPLYVAGLDSGDQIVKIGRQKIRNQKQWRRVLKRAKPGETISINFIQNGEAKSTEATFQSNRTLGLTPIKSKDDNFSEAAIKFRNDWLTTKIHNQDRQ